MDKVTLLHGNFSELDRLLTKAGVEAADGMLFDLGVSSPQLVDPARGFSYQHDAPLDMRMDQSDGLTAYTVVNEWPREELKRILRDYGEERYAGPIAAAIVRQREEAPIATTLQLVAVIKSAMPAAALREKQHPAKRSFQGIRIAVNGELDAVQDMLRQAVPRLNPGGRLCVITFHSLEDRIVKKRFRDNENPCICPPEFPVCMCGRKSKGTVITRKPVVPGEEELEYNKRSKSSKLRVFERA